MGLQINTPTSIAEPAAKVKQPKPTDFDKFLPWACKEMSIEADVVVTKGAQKSYVSASAKKKKSSLKLKKQQSVVSSAYSSDNNAENSALFDKPRIDNENVILIETVYDINENLVQLKFLKNRAIPRKVMKTIALTIPYQPYLTSIIINSGLRMDSLYEISKFLPKSNITEICLDSTFVSQANYHILLTDNKLKHLSLAKCTINDAVVKTIADQLNDPRPASRVLSVLNLSCNRITNVGAKYLADMLRTNRKLSYLNLAGNMITDEGGMNILDTLHEFPLHAQEVSKSRARYVTYLKQKNDLINAFILELQTGKIDRSPKKRMPKKSKLEAQSLHHNISSQKPLIDSGVETETIKEKAECLAEKKLGLFDEPFSPNNTKTRDGVVHCFGNNTLCYLNIAYNNLSYVSLQRLHEVLSFQKSLNRTPTGLIKVVIEGNLMPVACKEYEAIDQLLESCLGGTRKQSAIKKKPLSSRSTVTTTTIR